MDLGGNPTAQVRLGEPIGYRELSGIDQLNSEQSKTFDRLPDEFAFKEAMAVYGRKDQATRDFLTKCVNAALLTQPRKGRYRKVATAHPRGKGALREISTVY